MYERLAKGADFKNDDSTVVEEEAQHERLKLNYPHLPTELASVVDNQMIASSKNALEDYADFDLYDLIEDDTDRIDETARKMNVSETLDWNAKQQQQIRNHGNFNTSWKFRQNSLHRRAMKSLAKGAVFGAVVGSILAYGGTFVPRNRKLPLFWFSYVIGGTSFCCGTWNMVHQTRRYIEYINFQKTGVANPHSMDMDAAKEQLSTYMGQQYHPKLVKEWKESVMAEEFIKQETAM